MDIFTLRNWPTDAEYRRWASRLWIVQWADKTDPTRHFRCHSVDDEPVPRFLDLIGANAAYSRLLFVEDGRRALYRSFSLLPDGTKAPAQPLAGTENTPEHALLRALFSKSDFTNGVSLVAAAVNAFRKNLTPDHRAELKRSVGGILAGYRTDRRSAHRPLFFESGQCAKKVGPAGDDHIDVHCYRAPRPLVDLRHAANDAP